MRVCATLRRASEVTSETKAEILGDFDGAYEVILQTMDRLVRHWPNIGALDRERGHHVLCRIIHMATCGFFSIYSFRMFQL